MSNPLDPVSPEMPDESSDTDALGTPTNPDDERLDGDQEESSDEDDDADHVEGIDPDLQV